VRQIIQNVLARRYVDLDIAPLLGGDFGKPAFHQCFACRDDLDYGGVAGGEIAIDRFDQRRRFHRGDQVIEETLLGALERGTCGGFGLGVQRAGFAGDVGRLQRGVEVVVNDAEGASIGIVDTDLLVGELVLEQIIFHALVAERPCRIEAERPQIARQHLHGRDTAGLDCIDKLGAGGERELLATPQAEPLGIG
jgi:hypothetical protein